MAEAVQYVIEGLSKDLPPLRSEGISREIEEYYKALEEIIWAS